MKFTINLNKDDFAKFNKYSLAKIHQNRVIKWKITLFNFLYWFFLAFFLLEIYSVYDDNCCYDYKHLNRALIALFVWFVLAIIWQQIYMHIFVSSAVDENGSILGNWDFEISDLGITESNQKCSSNFSWSCIKSVEKDKYNLYLFTDNIKAIILPLKQINDVIEEKINKNIKER